MGMILPAGFGRGWRTCAAAMLVAVLPLSAAAAPPLISEIMFNPDGDENAREFVELYNPSGTAIDLHGWLIGDNDALDAIAPASGGTAVIPAGSHAVVLDPDYFAAADSYDIPPDAVLLTVSGSAIGARGLSNSTPETVRLVSAVGDTIAAVTYDISCPAGHSWEMIRIGSGSDAANYGPSINTGGTPGRGNSISPPPVNPALDSASIMIDTTNLAAGGNAGGQLSYLNAGSGSLAGVEVALFLTPGITVETCRFDATVAPGERSGAYQFIFGPLPGGMIELTAAISMPAAAQPAGDDTVRTTMPVAVPAGTVILNEVMAAPSDGPEWVELMNTGDWPVDLSGWRLADGAGSVSVGGDAHRFIAPDGFAILAAGDFAGMPFGASPMVIDRFPALNNDGDVVVLLDHAGAAIDSMAYDAVRNGVSFERIAVDMNGNGTAWDYSTAPGGATPGGVNSIVWGDAVPDDGVRLSVEPNPFLDRADVSYRLPFPVARVTLAVYDRRGRLAVTLRDAEESGASWSGGWDGCGGGARLPAGPYILQLEAFDTRTGRMVRARELVVVAAGL